MGDHHSNNPCQVCWQSNFFHQYMQQHAAMTQWINQLHGSIHSGDPNDGYEAVHSRHSQSRHSQSRHSQSQHSQSRHSQSQHSQSRHSLSRRPQSRRPLSQHPQSRRPVSTRCCSRCNTAQSNQSSETPNRSVIDSSMYSKAEEEQQEIDESSDDDDDDSSDCEYEFNVDAILAMRAAKKAMRNEMSKSSEDSDGSFVVINDDKEEYERDSLKNLGSEMSRGIRERNLSSEIKTEKQIKDFMYGERSATISGLETAMRLNFERVCDDYDPAPWPVLPVRL